MNEMLIMLFNFYLHSICLLNGSQKLFSSGHFSCDKYTTAILLSKSQTEKPSKIYIQLHGRNENQERKKRAGFNNTIKSITQQNKNSRKKN